MLQALFAVRFDGAAGGVGVGVIEGVGVGGDGYSGRLLVLPLTVA